MLNIKFEVDSLKEAVNNEDFETIKNILDNPEIADYILYCGRITLIYAVKNNKEEIVKAFIKYMNSSINLRDEEGRTALMYAIINDNIKMVRILLLNGANVNLKDEYNNTALNYACRLENLDVVRLLVKFE